MTNKTIKTKRQMPLKAKVASSVPTPPKKAASAPVDSSSTQNLQKKPNPLPAKEVATFNPSRIQGVILCPHCQKKIKVKLDLSKKS